MGRLPASATVALIVLLLVPAMTPAGVSAQAPLRPTVTKTDAPDPVAAGQNIVYTITVNNPKAFALIGLGTLTDPIPAGTSFVAGSIVAPAG